MPEKKLITKREAAVMLLSIGLLILVSAAVVAWDLRGGLLSRPDMRSSVSDSEQFENFVFFFWKPALVGGPLVWLGVTLWRSRRKDA